jgi:hypothetical protein
MTQLNNSLETVYFFFTVTPLLVKSDTCIVVQPDIDVIELDPRQDFSRLSSLDRKSRFFSELEYEISGEVGWQQKQYEVTGAGTHFLLWQYVKDGGGYVLKDCGFVDCVQ